MSDALRTTCSNTPFPWRGGPMPRQLRRPKRLPHGVSLASFGTRAWRHSPSARSSAPNWPDFTALRRSKALRMFSFRRGSSGLSDTSPARGEGARK